MIERTNTFGQPIGQPVPGWTVRPFPAPEPIDGRYCRLEKIDAARHAKDLFSAYAQVSGAADWTYLFAEPFAEESTFADYLSANSLQRDPPHYAILDAV